LVVKTADPLATMEFVAVDTETNGRGGEACELTEVGAVLVGGGELHDGWSSLVATRERLGRSIQRFTGITQQMLEDAPPPRDVLPRLAELVRGRVMIAHSASFDRRVLRAAFARAELDWPDPPVLCTVALARRLAPLHHERALAPRRARACSARCGRSCARTRRPSTRRSRSSRRAAAARRA
jgi:DNA polymerase-3 subunit epsilon